MRHLRTVTVACALTAPLSALADGVRFTAPSRAATAGAATGTATGAAGTATGATGTADPTGAGGDPTGAPAGIDAFLIEPGQGVRFEQIEFEMADGPALSAWGRVEVNPSLLARVTGSTRGFVNVFTDEGWVARNLAIDTRPSFGRAFADARIIDDGGALPLAFYFDLGGAEPFGLLTASVVFTEDPVLAPMQIEQAEALPPATFPLVKAAQNVSSGIVDGFVPQPPGGLPPPPPNPQIQMPDHLEGYWAVHTPNPLNVDAANNQCGPMAAANAFKYMEATWGPSRGFVAADPHIKSVGGGIGLAGSLDTWINRSEQGTCVGSGVGYCADDGADSALFTGAMDYIAFWNANRLNRIRVRYQGQGGDDCAHDTAVTAIDNGAEVTFDWLCDRIAAGDGVFLTYLRYKVDVEAADGPIYPGMYEVPTGGHAIRVHGCGEMGGRPFIKVLNDTRQDRMDDDICVERAGLESQLVYVEDIDYDGRLNYGDNPMWEIDFAMAASITP